MHPRSCWFADLVTSGRPSNQVSSLIPSEASLAVLAIGAFLFFHPTLTHSEKEKNHVLAIFDRQCNRRCVRPLWRNVSPGCNVIVSPKCCSIRHCDSDRPAALATTQSKLTAAETQIHTITTSIL